MAQERHSSKYCLTFLNLQCEEPLDGVLRVLNEYMGIPMEDYYPGTVHWLPGNGNGPKPIIVQFRYDHQRTLYRVEDELSKRLKQYIASRLL